MDKPTDSEFYLSLINLESDIKIFNLATNIHKIYGYSNSDINDWENYGIDCDEFLSDYLILWLLSIATSFKVKQTGRIFKSEYIVSQMLMQCLKKNKIDGVAYFSKRVDENTPYNEFGQLSINVAIMANFKEPWSKKYKGYSEICDKMNITNPLNYAEFKQIYRPDHRYQVKSDNSDESSYPKHASLGGIYINYHDTHFASYENHLKGLMEEEIQRSKCIIR